MLVNKVELGFRSMAAVDNIMTHLRTKLRCSPVEDPIE